MIRGLTVFRRLAAGQSAIVRSGVNRVNISLQLPSRASSTATAAAASAASSSSEVVQLTSAKHNPELYAGYDSKRTLSDVDFHASTCQIKAPVPSKFDLHGHTTFKFSNHFAAGSEQNISDVREGGYVALKDDDLAKYLPDGITGEVMQEFDFSEVQSWMVRDTSKVLCRLIEEYEASKNGAFATDRPAPKQSTASKPHLPGLHDRPERPDALLEAYRFGHKISADKRPSVGGFDIVGGTGSLAEGCIDALKKGDAFNGNKVPGQILVTGARGTGKSIALNQTALFARKRGWLVMVVDGWRQAHHGWFIEPYRFKDRKGAADLFDNSFMSAEVLRSFFRAHKGELNKIPIANVEKVVGKYKPRMAVFREEWDRTLTIAPPGSDFLAMRRLIEAEDNFEDEDAKDGDILKGFDFPNFEPKTLGDLITLGLAFRDFAGAAAMDLIDQLKELTSHRVLFLVDGYNSLENPSAYQYNNQVVMPKQMCVPRALNFLSRHKSEMGSWSHKNGLAIGFSSFRHPEQKDVYKECLNSFQLVLKSPAYSATEYLAAMRLYLEKSGVFGDDITTQELLSFRMHTQSNPRLLRVEAPRFFIPLSSQRIEESDDPFNPRSFGDIDAMLADEDVAGSGRRGAASNADDSSDSSSSDDDDDASSVSSEEN